jgi:hypothetical protein
MNDDAKNNDTKPADDMAALKVRFRSMLERQHGQTRKFARKVSSGNDEQKDFLKHFVDVDLLNS